MSVERKDVFSCPIKVCDTTERFQPAQLQLDLVEQRLEVHQTQETVGVPLLAIHTVQVRAHLVHLCTSMFAAQFNPYPSVHLDSSNCGSGQC